MSWYLDIWSLILNGKTRELKALGAGEKEIKVIGKRELCRYLGFWEQTLWNSQLSATCAFHLDNNKEEKGGKRRER